MYNVKDFGAQGNGQANEAAAIQSAIEACHQAGGGTVLLPAGEYRSGTLQLRSYVTLYLDAGATLLTSADPAEYESRPDSRGRVGYLLMANDVEHVTITGPGTVRGLGEGALGSFFGQPNRPAFRVGILLFEGCRHVAVRDITILYSDSWTLHFRRCERVWIEGVTILNDVRHINSDGIDPNSCRDVHIANCHIVAGDDCIVLKATEPYPCENVVVTNCTLETTCTAIKFGTESYGDFRDVHVSNCTIRNTSVGIGFYLKDGGTMERMTFSGISIENLPIQPIRHMVYPLYMDIERRDPDSKLGILRDIAFRDLHIYSGASALLQGMPEQPIENLSLENITMRVEQSADWGDRSKAFGGRRTVSDERDWLYARHPSYFTLAYVRGALVENVRVLVSENVFAQWPRAALSLHHVEGASLRNIRRTPACKTDE